MRLFRLSLCIWIVAAGSGCDVMQTICRTLVIEPLRYPVDAELERADDRHEDLADAAWTEYCSTAGGTSAGRDFERGFKAGFVRQLRFETGPIPPPLPPRRYWRDAYRTPEGQLAVRAWFDGFTTGANSAQALSYPNNETVPSSWAVSHPAPPAFLPPALPPGAAPTELPMLRVPPPEQTTPEDAGLWETTPITHLDAPDRAESPQP